MENLLPICCQENCPIGKRCCFGEVYIDTIGEIPIRERHKCNYRKQTGKTFVDTEIVKPAA